MSLALTQLRRWACAAGIALVCAADLAPALAEGSLEYPVKAAYLYKFAPFIQWPATAFDSPSSPFAICIVGADPFGSALDQAVASQRFDARPIVVKRLAKVDRTSGCHVVYLGGGKGAGAADALAAVRGAPVLTVSDAAGRDDVRGVIDFQIRDNRVRFSIDDQAAQANGLVISSKLLSLAVAVRLRSSGLAR